MVSDVILGIRDIIPENERSLAYFLYAEAVNYIRNSCQTFVSNLELANAFSNKMDWKRVDWKKCVIASKIIHMICPAGWMYLSMYREECMYVVGCAAFSNILVHRWESWTIPNSLAATNTALKEYLTSLPPTHQRWKNPDNAVSFNHTKRREEDKQNTKI